MIFLCDFDHNIYILHYYEQRHASKNITYLLIGKKYVDYLGTYTDIQITTVFPEVLHILLFTHVFIVYSISQFKIVMFTDGSTIFAINNILTRNLIMLANGLSLNPTKCHNENNAIVKF